MKRTALIGLILVMACLLGACSVVPQNSRSPASDYTLPPLETESGANNPSQNPSVTIQPSNPEDLIGRWHGLMAATAFEFTADGKVTMYQLAPGYYEYNFVEEGTYTYDGLTLTCILPSFSNFMYSCSVNQTQMSLTVSYQSLAFTPVNELPTEHPQYDFPDFDQLVKAHPLNLDFYIGKEFETEVSKDDLKHDIAINYWTSVKESDRIKVDGATAKLGDLVNIDYEGKLDGVAFSGGTATNQTIEVNDGTNYIDGFCTGVVGHKVGEPFDVEVTFPTDYGSASLAGQKVIFTMKLNAIYSTELTDEIAKKQGYDTVDAWVDQIYENQVGSLLWSENEEWKSVEIPEEAYLFFYQYNLDSAQANALYYFNNDLDAYLEAVKKTKDDLLKSAKEQAIKFYLSAQIVDKHELTAEDSLKTRLEDEYISDYVQSGYTEAQAREVLENEGKTEFQALLEMTLAQRYFVRNNTFKVVEKE